MKPATLSVLALVCFTVIGVRLTDAAEPSSSGKIRVLLTYGGHAFEEKPFFVMFDALPNIVYTKAELPKAADMLRPGLEKEYDVIVMYDMVSGFTPEQQKSFVELLKQGIGLVSLHHNLCAHDAWSEYRQIIGGKYLYKETTIDGKKCGPSDYSDDQDMAVAVADRQHPITAGIDDFKIHDEAYHNFYTAPDVKVLLTTDHPKCDASVAWVKPYGKSRIFYFMFGHDPTAWQNANYPRILGNGIRWAAAK